MKTNILIQGFIIATIILAIELLAKQLLGYAFLFSLIELTATFFLVNYFAKKYKATLSKYSLFGFGKSFIFSFKLLLPTFFVLVALGIILNISPENIQIQLETIESQFGSQMPAEFFDTYIKMVTYKPFIITSVVLGQSFLLLFYSLINALIIKKKIY